MGGLAYLAHRPSQQNSLCERISGYRVGFATCLVLQRKLDSMSKMI